MATVTETFQSIRERMDRIQAAYMGKQDFLVLAELREGKPVIVARDLKAFGKSWQRGEEFTCELSDLPAVAQLMENSPSGRPFMTKQAAADFDNFQRLKVIRERLEPMAKAAQDFQAKETRARGDMEAAEQRAVFARGEMEAAASNHARVEREAAEYIAGVNLDI